MTIIEEGGDADRGGCDTIEMMLTINVVDGGTTIGSNGNDIDGRYYWQQR